MSGHGKQHVAYRRHRAGYPPMLVSHLQARGVALPGQLVVDLGSGTGSLARLCARAGCQVIAVDTADALAPVARELDRTAGVSVRQHVALPEDSGLPAGVFDIVTIGSCWHWRHPGGLVAEARRLLKPGGKVVFSQFEWISLPGGIVAATEETIRRYDPDWPSDDGTGLCPGPLLEFGAAGFAGIETFSFDREVPFTHEGWCQRFLDSLSIYLPAAVITAMAAELRQMLRCRFPRNPVEVPHRSFSVVARQPAAQRRAA